MKSLSIAAALAFIAAAGSLPTIAVAAEDPVPCEIMLEDVKAAMKTATMSDADMAKVTDLEGQGIERCKADDDAGADAFFTEAMTIIDK